ncbi:hypothetical protein E2320_013671 [Naja naja]|nr:hypothetical protein E2320_013671 [Naja naja]
MSIPGSPISYSKIFTISSVLTIQFIAILFLIPKVRFWPSCLLFQKYSPCLGCWQSLIPGHLLSNSKILTDLLSFGKSNSWLPCFLFQRHSLISCLLASQFSCPLSYSKILTISMVSKVQFLPCFLFQNTHHLLAFGKVQFLAVLSLISKILTISWVLTMFNSWLPFPIPKYSPSPGVDNVQFLAVIFPIPKILTISWVLAKSNSCCFLFPKNAHHLPGFLAKSNSWPNCFYSKNTHHLLVWQSANTDHFPIPKYSPSPLAIPGHPVSYSKNTHHFLGVGNVQFLAILLSCLLFQNTHHFLGVGKSNSWPSCFLFKNTHHLLVLAMSNSGSPISYSKNTHHLLCVDTIQFLAILFPSKSTHHFLLLAMSNSWTILFPIPKIPPSPVCWQCPIPGILFLFQKYHLLAVWQSPIPGHPLPIPKYSPSPVFGKSNPWPLSIPCCPLSYSKNTHHLLVLESQFWPSSFQFQKYSPSPGCWQSPIPGRLFPIPKILTISWVLAKSNSWALFLFPKYSPSPGFGKVQFLAKLFPIQKYSPSPGCWQSQFLPSSFLFQNTHHLLCVDTIQFLAVLFLYSKSTHHLLCVGKVQFLDILFPIPKILTISAFGKVQFLAILFPIPKILTTPFLAILFPIPKILTTPGVGKVQFLAVLFPIPKILTISCLLAKSNFSCPLSYSKILTISWVLESPFLAVCLLFQKYSPSPVVAMSNSWPPISYSKNIYHLLCVDTIQFIAILFLIPKVRFLAILFAIPKILTMSWMLAESNSWPSSFQLQKYSLISCLLVKSNSWLPCFLFQRHSLSPVFWRSPIFPVLFPIPKILTISMVFTKSDSWPPCFLFQKYSPSPTFWQSPIPGCPLSDFQNTNHLLGVDNVQFLAALFPIPKILTISCVLTMFNSLLSSFLFQKCSPSAGCWQSPIPGRPVFYSQNTHHLLAFGKVRFLAKLFAIQKILTISWVANTDHPLSYSKNTHQLLCVGKVQFLDILFAIPKIRTISWVLAMSNSWPSCYLFQKYSPSPGCWPCPIPGSPISYSKNTHHLLCYSPFPVCWQCPIPGHPVSYSKNTHHFLFVGNVQFLAILFAIPKIPCPGFWQSPIPDRPASYSKNTHHVLGVGKVQSLAILFAIPKILTISYLLAKSNSWLSSF